MPVLNISPLVIHAIQTIRHLSYLSEVFAECGLTSPHQDVIRKIIHYSDRAEHIIQKFVDDPASDTDWILRSLLDDVQWMKELLTYDFVLDAISKCSLPYPSSEQLQSLVAALDTEQRASATTFSRARKFAYGIPIVADSHLSLA